MTCILISYSRSTHFDRHLYCQKTICIIFVFNCQIIRIYRLRTQVHNRCEDFTHCLIKINYITINLYNYLKHNIARRHLEDVVFAKGRALDCESGDPGSIPRQRRSFSLWLIMKSFLRSFALYSVLVCTDVSVPCKSEGN
jgi:hypothetical protein